MIGSQFKHGFELLFAQMKCTVYLHKNYGTANQSSSEHQALKNSEKNQPSKVMFQFPERVDIAVGDKIQQKNASDLWEVYEVEDRVISDVFIHFTAKVNKVGAAKPYQPAGSIIIQGSNYGAIQANSTHSRQIVVVNNTNVSLPIAALKQLLITANVDEIDREECDAALSRIEDLSTRPAEPKVMEKMKQKLDIVNATFAVAKNVSELAKPYIETIGSILGIS